MKKEVKHRIIRDDLLGGLSFAKGVLETTARHAPPAILFAYTFARLVEPIPDRGGPADRRDVIRDRLIAIQTPFVTMLGLMYQGPLGALAATLLSMIGAMVVPFRFTQRPDKQWSLDILDAAFAAGFLPIILTTLQGEGKERSSLL